MKFNDIVVKREERYSLGIEEDSHGYYASFPVSNGLVDYEEYYEIDKATFERFRSDAAAALAFVERARRRELDDRLIVKPGRRRGTAI